MTDTTDPAVTAAAQALARSEQAAEAANADFRTAESKRDELRIRLQTLNAQRREIGIRRSTGDHRLDDAGELALLAADHEALTAILATQDAAVASARAQADRAIAAQDVARHTLQRAELLAWEAALLNHVRLAETQMIASINGLLEIRKAHNGGMPAYQPATELMTRLNQLTLFGQRGW